MSRRPQPTFADYLVIALSPALIMLLVASLVFFLIEVFYRGQYDSRLTFIMAMFVMAAVLIARISIEESREYAALFAIPLAVVTAIAMHRFVEFSGPLQSLSPVINLGLIGTIWWCADKLTWDSTVIDESKDASGEGLLQTAGLDDQATTQDATTAAAAAPEPTGLNFWQRFVAYRRRPHAPGVWVIYFSLAALPIFGFGHWFIPGDNLAGRRYVFQLLVVFVAAALGLLLTTSFLNLRRYLRQRRLEMPVEMAGTWIGTGAAMIAVLLLFCMLLPRRNPEYSITQLPIFAGSPGDLWTTEYAVGNEGKEDPEQADRSGEQPASDEPTDDSQPQKSGKSFDDPNARREEAGDSSAPSSSGSPSESGEQSNAKSGQKSPAKQGKASPKSPSKQESAKSSSADSKSTDPEATPPENQESQERESQQNDSQAEREDASEPQSRERRRASSPPKNEPSESKRSKTKPGKSSRPSQPSSVTKFDPSKLVSALGGTIGSLLKFLYWVIAVAIAAYFTWKYWRQIREALVNFWRAMREFWESLWARKPNVEDEPAMSSEVEPPPKPFAAFPDPFLTGMAQGRPPVEVVQYSFAAFEAWAREQGCARTPEQTPHEFVQTVAHQQGRIAREATRLADLYSRCAYAQGLQPQVNVESLRQLWQLMRDGAAARSIGV